MTEGQVTENTDRPSLSEVESVVRELAADHVVSQVDWYSDENGNFTVCAHSSGVLVILASVMIPVLAQSQFARRDLVLVRPWRSVLCSHR